MRRRLKKDFPFCTTLIASLCFAGSLVRAQQPCPAPVSPPICPTPGYPYMPGRPMPPELTTPPGMLGQPGSAPATEATVPSTAEAAFASLGAGAGVGESVALAAPGGYLDSAIPKTMFRLRYDAAFNDNRPDRAEYFYATWREIAFHPHGINGEGVVFDPKAHGPTILPSSVNFQEVSSYLEYAFNCRLSAFAEIPVRYVNFRHPQEDNPESEIKQNPANFPAPGSPFFPEPGIRGMENPTENKNPTGLGDIYLGFKFAFVADPDRYLTFQFRTFIPTGDSFTGLGTGHPSLEPSLLYYRRLDRLVFQGQLTDWIPIGGGPFAGNVLSYGVGMGYDVYQCRNLRVTPIVEFVGWSVLSGLESVFGPISVTTKPANLDVPRTHGALDASGDTIINAKVGVRTYFGGGSDVYIGYGHALTEDRWYKEILRVEYRFVF
jgi:hypothetical protein